MYHPAENAPPQIIRAERILPAGSGESGLEVLCNGIVGGEPGRQEPRAGQYQQHNESKQGPPCFPARLPKTRKPCLGIENVFTHRFEALPSMSTTGSSRSGFADRATRKQMSTRKFTREKTTATNSAHPCIIAKSRLNIASTSNLPMPGQAKMVSTITAPSSR